MEILNPQAFAALPACVLLDLDNTLYEYAPAHAHGTAAAMRLAQDQLNITEADFKSCLADARTEIKNRLGRTAAAHHRLLYFQRMIERAGLSSQPLVAMQMDQAYWRAFMSAAELFDQVTDFLDDLRIAGIPIVIVTDLVAHIQFRKILHFGLDRYVDWIVTSEEVGTDKPAPAAFEYALAKLGGVEGPVWMIGEEPRSDIGGARAAVGAIGLQKRHEGVEIFRDGPNSPDLIFDRFGELRELLTRF